MQLAAFTGARLRKPLTAGLPSWALTAAVAAVVGCGAPNKKSSSSRGRRAGTATGDLIGLLRPEMNTPSYKVVLITSAALLTAVTWDAVPRRGRTTSGIAWRLQADMRNR